MAKDGQATYYDAWGIDTLDVIKAKLTPEQYAGFLLGNSLKYGLRLNHKGAGPRDAEKLAFYAARLAEHLSVHLSTPEAPREPTTLLADVRGHILQGCPMADKLIA